MASMTPAVLHHDSIARDPATENWLLLLHGILGSGSNWRGFARRLTERLPDWGCVTVDLRLHGRSQELPPPHTVARCAEDLRQLEDSLGIAFSAVVGHSFGSKVALAYLEQRRLEEHAVSWACLVDGDPAATPQRASSKGSDLVLSVLDSLSAMPTEFASRSDFAAPLLAKGLTQGLVDWLGMNLERTDSGYRFRLSIPKIRGLLDDYFHQDGWPWLEANRESTQMTFVVASDSSAVSTESLTRLRQHHDQQALELEEFSDCGHWVHIDRPQELQDVVVRNLKRL